MALYAKHNDTKFGVGDTVRVMQTVQEGDKSRLQAFEGVVIGIKGEGNNKTFTVRRIGAQQIGIERIFPLISPVIDKIEVVRKGTLGTKRAKLYYLRGKPKREIEKIYSKAKRKAGTKEQQSGKKSKAKKKGGKNPKKNANKSTKKKVKKSAKGSGKTSSKKSDKSS